MSPPFDQVMTEALAWLRKNGLAVRPPPTRFQIKIGDVSYYPHRGTIFVDGETRRRPDRGLEAFKDLLIRKDLMDRFPPLRLITDE